MIVSFSDPATEAFHRSGARPRAGWQGVASVAAGKLDMIKAAVRLDDLRMPPGNKLEALEGERRGPYSVRIDEQWRICFVWTEAGPADVEIVDYHSG